ncbi:HD-GYP domain-containing protein [Halobacteroides halobius DSM 5150]|uniref:HD-GYP domain-containing protein n=1 Tax=Halobacteroides halobius (strain ATCC 35273 / DSM 5150 / MD-1) TaxID=748449 RepID=L0K6K2_HALHC|nr:HD domain-containing phosphohydrolase [Halobacteroides halobius]AGB40882.1 HD-GYP domain-containing protein [Halobacteroides halobius DSM 5150]
MELKLEVSLFDMVVSLSDALDLISSTVTGHHKRVAYIATSIADKLDLSQQEKEELLIAGALHDVGALALNKKLSSLMFDFNASTDVGNHAELGYQTLHKFSPFKRVAKIIRYHHTSWKERKKNSNVVLAANILYLADRIDVLIDFETEILSQTDRIKDQIKEYQTDIFFSKVVEAFLDVATKDAFWFNIVSSWVDQFLVNSTVKNCVKLDFELLLRLAQIFGRIIDFRSSFTATHSSGVAASAQRLARLSGFSRAKFSMMRIAGYLHDLGKLAIPVEILNKTGKLTATEFNIIKKHTFYTYQILDGIPELAEIKNWAAFHHERLDGAGYPFGLDKDKLSRGARIMGVADVFTAITEDRPYRAGMEKEQATKILTDMVQDGAVDGSVVQVLVDNYEGINHIRKSAQAIESEEYKKFRQRSI